MILVKLNKLNTQTTHLMDRYMGRMANSGKVCTLIIITMTTHLMDRYMGRMANSGKVCTLIIITMNAKYRITLMKPETYKYIVCIL